MKYLIYCFFLLLTTGTCIGQVNDNNSFFDYSYDKEKIKKRSIASITICPYMNGKALSKGKYDFDKEGRLLSIHFFDSSGKPKSEYEYGFNDHNDVISRKNNDHEYGTSYEERFYKKYEGNKLVFDSSTVLPVWYEYKYTKNGNLLQTITHNKFDSSIIVIIGNEYDASNKLIAISEKQYRDGKDTIGEFISHRIIHYDEKHRKIKEEELISNDNSFLMINKGSIEYAYDSIGNLIQIKREKAASRFYKYDRNGLIVSVKMDMDLKDDLPDGSEIKIISGDGYTYEFRK
ncbi:MAG: hypothetical protein QM737_05635 [Ferruginibacter sp.]